MRVFDKEIDKVQERDLSFYIYFKIKLEHYQLMIICSWKLKIIICLKSNSIHSVSNLYLFIDKYFGGNKKKDFNSNNWGKK